MTPSERLTHARLLAADLSARELSILAGLSDGLVALIESGVRGIGGRSAVALGRVLGVSSDWLLAGIGDEPSSRVVRRSVAAAREQKGAA